MRAQRFSVSIESRIVAGSMASSTTIYSRFAELRHDNLLDPRTALVHSALLRVALGQAAGLLKIGGLVLFPPVEKLIVKHHAVHDQDDKARDCQGYARAHRMLLRLTTARRTPSLAPGRMFR